MILRVRPSQVCVICNHRLLNKQPLSVLVKCQHLFHTRCLNTTLAGHSMPNPCPMSSCKHKIKNSTFIQMNPQVVEDKSTFPDTLKIKRWLYVGAVALSILAFGVWSFTMGFLVVSSVSVISAYLVGRGVDWYFGS